MSLAHSRWNNKALPSHCIVIEVGPSQHTFKKSCNKNVLKGFSFLIGFCFWGSLGTDGLFTLVFVEHYWWAKRQGPDILPAVSEVMHQPGWSREHPIYTSISFIVISLIGRWLRWWGEWKGQNNAGLWYSKSNYRLGIKKPINIEI